METAIDLAIACDLDALPEVQAKLIAFAEGHDLPPRIAQALDLTTDEIISNIIRHSFKDDTTGKAIACRAEVTDAGLDVAFRDNGPPFNPLTDAPEPDLDADIASRQVGGLGVFLVKQMTDDCVYERAEPWNVLTLSWRL